MMGSREGHTGSEKIGQRVCAFRANCSRPEVLVLAVVVVVGVIELLPPEWGKNAPLSVYGTSLGMLIMIVVMMW